MNWILLILAGCLELVFTFCLGKINRVFGMEKYVWSFVLLVSLCVSMLLLIKVTKTLPVGTAYAIWTGIGAAGTVLIGIFFFKEPASVGRLFFIDIRLYPEKIKCSYNLVVMKTKPIFAARKQGQA